MQDEHTYFLCIAVEVQSVTSTGWHLNRRAKDVDQFRDHSEGQKRHSEGVCMVGDRATRDIDPSNNQLYRPISSKRVHTIFS